jgi:hypothetical protein
LIDPLILLLLLIGLIAAEHHVLLRSKISAQKELKNLRREARALPAHPNH